MLQIKDSKHMIQDQKQVKASAPFKIALTKCQNKVVIKHF